MWNRLGHVWQAQDRPASAYDAMCEAKAMFAFTKKPLTYTDPLTGAEIESGAVAVLRGPTSASPEYRHVATVDKRFEIVQPADIATILDTGFGGEPSIAQRWPVQACGVTPNNAGMFITFQSSAYDVNGDQMDRYFILTNGNDGGTALSVGVIHLRLACWNTLTAALKGATSQIKIAHRAKASEYLSIYTRIIGDMERAETQTTEAFQRMASMTITHDEVMQVIDRTFPMIAKPAAVHTLDAYNERGLALSEDDRELLEGAEYRYENKQARQAELRTAALDLHQRFNDEFPRSANTPWSIFNAVAELLDNRAAKGEGDKALDNAALDTMFGHRARSRDDAFRAAYALVTA